MVIYKINYCNFFDLEEGDYIGSEISGELAVDLHHIHAKQMGGKKWFTHDGVEYEIDCIENIIAVTRREHDRAHSGGYSRRELWDIHKEKMEQHLSTKSKQL